MGYPLVTERANIEEYTTFDNEDKGQMKILRDGVHFTNIGSDYDEGELEGFSGFESLSDSENFVRKVKLPELKKCCVLLKKLPEYEELQCSKEWSSISKKYKCNKENLNPKRLYLMDCEKNGFPVFDIFDSENLYKCAVCSQNFNRRSSLTNHFQVAHALKPFKCSACCMTFSCYDNFMSHNQIAHTNLKSTEEQCAIDIKPFVSNEKRIKPYKCQLCDRGFNHSITLSLHYQNIHRNFQVADSFTNCNLSGSPKERHFPRFNNETVVTDKSILTDILRDLEARYISTCIDCNSSFRFQNLLKHVNLIHPGKSVYCSCGFKGNFNATLLHSFEMSHLPNELRPIILGSEDGENNLIICLQLKASYPAKPMHNGKQSRYNCNVCFLRFASISHFKKHNNIYHGKVKSFRCLYCDNLFGHEKNLLRHILSMHNQYKAFMCLKCYRSFTHFKNLIYHLRFYHKILDPYEELERERLMSNNNLISAVHTKQTTCESLNSNKLTKVENEKYTCYRKSRTNKISNSKLLLKSSFCETIASNVLNYLGERFNVTCSLCCHKLSFCELDSHIKKVHHEQSVWCTCGFKGELSVVMVHAFNLSHLPNETQPIILRSDMTDFKFDMILIAIKDLPDTYPCFKCSKIFVNEELQTCHYDMCKLEKNIVCDICDKSFVLFFHLQMHKATRHKFNCLYCDESFGSNGTLSKHILHTHKELFHQQCRINEYDYSSFENQACDVECNEGYNKVIMKESVMQQIALTESDLYTSSSDNEFEELQLLRSRKCRKCNDTFNTSTQLKVHSRIHDGKKPHSCQCCSEMFISLNLLSKHNLKAHGKFYTNRDQTTKRKYAYRTSNSHDSSDSDEWLPQSRVKRKRPHPVKSRSHSSNNVESPFLGHNESQQILLTLSDLSTSSSETEVEEASSLQCKLCDDSFLTSKQFKVHLRLHNGKRPHSCHHCMQTFFSHNLLLKHRLKNHREREILPDVIDASRRESTSSVASDRGSLD